MSFAFAVVYEDTVASSITANCYEAGYEKIGAPQIKVKIMILYTRGIGMFSSLPPPYIIFSLPVVSNSNSERPAVRR